MTGVNATICSRGGNVISTLRRMTPVAVVFLVFVTDSFARYPVPGPNEPHYLCKARHYWDPEWCAGDFFLESSNAHLVFFQTFGQLTRFFSFETSAIVGRLVGLATLAAGWLVLVRALVPGRWAPVRAALILVGLSALGSLSGEWLFDGIESKVVAYGLVFGALGCLLDSEWGQRHWALPIAGLLLGIAISFHPVVGCWAAGASILASIARRAVAFVRRASSEPVAQRSGSYMVAGVLLVLAAAPGVWAGWKAAGGSSVEADYIQVYYRLSHHLDPSHFTADLEHAWQSPWVGYSVLIAVWLAARRFAARRQGERWFFWFVVGSGLIATAGLLIGLRSGPPEHVANYWFSWKGLDYPVRWKLLKLYPFRLFDIMLPIAVSIAAAGIAQKICNTVASRHTGQVRLAIWLACAIPAAIAIMHPAADARPPLTEQEIADWDDACRWIEGNAPANALVLTPTQESWAFKWKAQRAEFVSYKDCPQDGPGIVEWNNRLLFVRQWAEQNFEQGYSRRETEPLRAQGITHIVARRLGPFNFAPVYRNDTFRVYDIEAYAGEAPNKDRPPRPKL